MQLYHFTNREPGAPLDLETDVSKFAGTRADAKDFIRTVLPNQRTDFFVELVAVSTDKDTVLEILEGKREFMVLKRWKFTGRGGLRECDDKGHYLQKDEE